MLCVRGFPSLNSTVRHYLDLTRGNSRPQGLVASLLEPEPEDHGKMALEAVEVASYTTSSWSWRMNA